MKLLRVDDVMLQPWKNGGGATRELLAWPTPKDWWLRISVAEIERDGPFSAYPGVDRWFGVLLGDGVRLRWSGEQTQAVRAGDDLLHFDGAEPPEARLLGGATRDLNVMRRRGLGRVAICAAAQPAPEGFAMLALFTRDALRIEGGAAGAIDVPAMCLAWSAWQPWRVVQPGLPCAWWIAFSPAAGSPQ
jgi:environmental stress-induced protein Ves